LAKTKSKSHPSTSLRIVKHFFPKVSKVNDSHENAIVEVTNKDTSHAKVRDHSACAMAVACKRTFKADGVIISVKTAYLIKGDIATRFQLPESIAREVVSFDRNAGFEEGVYQLSKVSKSKELGRDTHSNQKDRHVSREGETKTIRHFTKGIRVALGSKVDPLGITQGSLAPR
jgi:hypothetical protein